MPRQRLFVIENNLFNCICLQLLYLNFLKKNEWEGEGEWVGMFLKEHQKVF